MSGHHAFRLMKSSFQIGIVGASGAVGEVLLDVLHRREFPVDDLRLLASPRSSGKGMKLGKREFTVHPLTVESFTGLDLVFFTAGAAVSREFAPLCLKSGAIVIDNSSAFRLADSVPLIVPGVNDEALSEHSGLIANPNCTTAVTLMALAPLHRAFGVKRIIASTYQAVSGAGARGIYELHHQTKQVLRHHEAQPEIFDYPIAFNVIPHIDSFEPNCYTREEMKMQNEGGKILGLPNFRASTTCVRVPVERAHSVAVTAEFDRPIDLDLARKVIDEAPGVALFDDPDFKKYPMPLECAGQDKCFVGRLREDLAFDHGLSFWVCGDQLLRGAALNAVEIAELALLGKLTQAV